MRKQYDNGYLMDLSGEDWRNIFLAIIASTTTIVTVIGPLVINRWIERAKEDRLAAAAKVEAAAVEVAAKVEEVKIATKATASGMATLQRTADQTHHIVNSRYDEIRQELKLSNENNARMTKILTTAGILQPVTAAVSEVVAEPDSVPVKQRSSDLELLARRDSDLPPTSAEINADPKAT